MIPIARRFSSHIANSRSRAFRYNRLFMEEKVPTSTYVHSARIEPAKLIFLVGTRITYQATGDAGFMCTRYNTGTAGVYCTQHTRPTSRTISYLIFSETANKTNAEQGSFFLLFFSPSDLLSSPFYFLSLLVVTQIRGHIAGSSSSLPTTVRALHFYREKISALSSLVDSR